MDVLEHLATRRSVNARTMVAPGPTAEQIERLVALATRVPDHGKLAPWHVQVVTGAAQVELGDVIAAAFRADHPDAEPAQVDLEAGRPARSPVLLIVSTRTVEGGRIPVIEQLMSAGALCMNLVHAACGLGYVAQWVTEWPAYDSRVTAALGVPLGDQVVGWIHVGSAPASHVVTERPRPALADVMSYWAAPV